jgi:hypothetical protein
MLCQKRTVFFGDQGLHFAAWHAIQARAQAYMAAVQALWS